MSKRPPTTKTQEGTLSKALFLRVGPEDIDRLDALSARLPVVSKNAIARTAMRLGMAILEEDPTRVLDVPSPRRGRRRR